MRIPLFLSQQVQGPEDALKRVELHMHMNMVTHGKGFRQSSKRSKPTRIEKIAERFYGV